jgi:minichromosome maintenance protein 10
VKSFLAESFFFIKQKMKILSRTSGMSTSSTSSSTHKRKTAYDPQRQWGLKPEDGSIGDGATYVVSGHVVSGTSSDPRTTYLTETIGRDGQAKAKRKMGGGQDAADRALKALLERDKEGMKAVMSARESGKVLVNSEEGRKGRNKCEQGKGDRKDKQKHVPDACDEEPDACGAEKKRQSSYSSDIIRSLGFDPSIKTGSRRTDNSSSQNKVSFPFLVISLFLLSLFASWIFWKLSEHLGRILSLARDLALRFVLE